MTKDVMLGSLLLILAIMLDGLQVLIGLGITVSFAGISTIATWITWLVPAVGAAISSLATGVGMVVGAGIDICLSASFGSVLVGFLILNNMFYPVTVFSSATFEMLPFLDIFPGWTVMVARCLWKKHFGSKGVVAAAATVVGGAIVAGGATGAFSASNDNTPSLGGNNQASAPNGAKMSVQTQLNKDVRPRTTYAK
jgi:hypothetical protein